ncbi:MAG: glycoside-pentoside-hexuronide (GPH):cation symporter [Pseudomonadota bacterium]
MTATQAARAAAPGLRTIIGYGVGNFGFMLAWIPANFFLLNLYTDIYGLTGAQAGSIFLIALIWDGITDPLMGGVVDRVKTRWGRYRPFILFGSPLLGLCLILAFTPPPDGSPTQLFTLALVTQLLFRTAFTIVYIPYLGMIARISVDGETRSRIAGVKSLFVYIAFIFVSFAVPVLISKLGNGDRAHGYFFTAILLAAMLIVLGGVTFLSTKEMPIANDESEKRVSLKTTFRYFRSNWPITIILFGVFVYSTGFGVYNASIIYVARYYYSAVSGIDTLAGGGATSAILTPQFIAALVFVPVWTWVCVRWGKKVCWIAGALLAATGVVSLYIAQPTTLTGISTFYVIIGAAGPAYLIAFYAITADAIDYGELASGYRPEAASYGLLSLANKAATGAGTFILGVGLDRIGFVANIQQSAEVAKGVLALATLAPAVAYIAAVIVVYFYPITPLRHQDIVEKLSQRSD